MDIKGVVLASGKGTRLLEISDTPKPLKVIHGHILLQHTLKRFISAGITEIFVVIRYGIEDFTNFINQFNARNTIKANLIVLESQSYIDSPINDLLLVKNQLVLQPNEKLFISYSDIVTNVDLQKVIHIHTTNNAEMTMLLFEGNKDDYSHRYIINSLGGVSIMQKGNKNEEKMYANGGIFILNNSLLNGYDAQNKIGFSEDNGPAFRANANKTLYGLEVGHSYYKEVGYPKYFRELESDLLQNTSLVEDFF